MTTIAPQHRTALGPHLRDLQVILTSAPARAAVVVACTVPAATSGPPLHVHAASDETFFILSGKLLLHADGHVTTIREGGLVHISCGMPHTFATTPGTPARFLLLYTTRPDPMTAALAGPGTGTPAPAASLTIPPGNLTQHTAEPACHPRRDTTRTRLCAHSRPTAGTT